jgi:hypothetical protein
MVKFNNFRKPILVVSFESIPDARQESARQRVTEIG